jgi:hypothetical protein
MLSVDDFDIARERKVALESFYDNFSATNACNTNELGRISPLVRHMMDAVGINIYRSWSNFRTPWIFGIGEKCSKTKSHDAFNIIHCDIWIRPGVVSWKSREYGEVLSERRRHIWHFLASHVPMHVYSNICPCATGWSMTNATACRREKVAPT